MKKIIFLYLSLLKKLLWFKKKSIIGLIKLSPSSISFISIELIVSSTDILLSIVSVGLKDNSSVVNNKLFIALVECCF